MILDLSVRLKELRLEKRLRQDQLAALVGLVLIVCTFKGFSLFGGKLNALGIVLCVAISAGMLYIAEQISVAWEILDVFGVDYGVTFAQAYRSIPQFMQDNDFKMAVIQIGRAHV